MINSKIRNVNLDVLLDAVLTLNNQDEAYQFFEDLCTASELTAMAQRYRVARMLRDRCTCKQIVQQTGSSTATIARVNRSLNYGTGGYDMVMNRIEKVESADGAE